jgi:hypothetical protein
VAHRVTLIPGDGTGPEIAEATRRVIEATGVDIDWDVRQAGADVMDEHGGNPLPDHVLESIKANGVAIKGPITTPVGGGFRSVNVALRKTLDLYAQVRPCKSYEGVRSRFDDVDLVIVRENTEDLYAGIEYEQGTDEAPEPSGPMWTGEPSDERRGVHRSTSPRSPPTQIRRVPPSASPRLPWTGASSRIRLPRRVLCSAYNAKPAVTGTDRTSTAMYVHQ